jgi:hypothetical protein
MTFRRQLAKTELVALATFVGVAACLAALSAVRAASSPGDLFSPLGAAVAVAGFTLAIGFVVVAVFGAPFYAWLQFRGRASWTAATCLGLAPGIALSFVALDLGFLAMGCGLVVALATHAICRLGA